MQCKKSTHTANWFGAIISNLTTFKKQRLSRTDISPKRLVGYPCQFVTAKTFASLVKETRYSARILHLPYREGLEQISNLIFKKQRLPSVLHPPDTKFVAPFIDAAVGVRCWRMHLTIPGLKKTTLQIFFQMEYCSRYWMQQMCFFFVVWIIPRN